MRAKQWATRELWRRDLTALAAIAQGAPAPPETRARRLRRRGFVSPSIDRPVTVTVRGRLALLIKRMTIY